MTTIFLWKIGENVYKNIYSSKPADFNLKEIKELPDNLSGSKSMENLLLIEINSSFNYS